MPYQITLPDGSLGWIADSVPRSKALDVAKRAYPEAFPEAPGVVSQLLNVPKEFVKGAASGVVQAAGGLGALPYAGARYLAPGLKPFAETGFGQAITSAEQYLAPSDEGAITQVAGGLGSLASILGPQVALRGLGAAGRFAGMAPGAARPVGVAQVSGLGAEEARQRAEIARGDGIEVSPGQELTSLIGGAGIGLLELSPIERLLRGVDKAFAPTVANYIKRAATQFGVEGAQEAAAGILQDLNARGVYNPNMPIGDSALGDALLGGSVGAIAQSGLDFLVRKDIAKAYQARLSQERQQELDTRLETMRQERDAQIAQTTKNLGVPNVLMLPAPAPQVEAPRETDPLMNPVGFFNSDELSPQYLRAVNKMRKDDGKTSLSQFSIEDLADAGAPQQEIDRLLTYKTGYNGQTPLAAEDVLNLAEERNVNTTTAGFRDFLRRATGSENLGGMSQPQLFSAFKALDALQPSETPQILPSGTNATRFSKDQYERSVRSIKTLFPKSNMMSREKAIKEIKDYSGLENDQDAESLLQTAIRNGDFGTSSRKVYEVVIPSDPEAPAVRRYTTRDAAERAAASLGLDVRERIHQEVALPGVPGELPGGPDIRKGTFKQGEAPAAFEIRSPDAVLKTAATQEEADAEAERLQQLRAQKANGVLGKIATNEAKIAKSQRKLESMEADGEADTLDYKKMAAGIAAQNKRLRNDINALKAEVQSYLAPLEIAPKGQKPVTRQGFTLFEEGNPVATFPDQQAAEEAAIMRLPDETLQTIVNLAPSQKGLMPKRLGAMAKAELDRRTDQQPPGFGVAIKGDKAAADERLAQLGIFTPEFQKAADELTKKLRPMMERLGLRDLQLNILKAIKNAQGQSADGYYAKQLIAIALDAENPMRTLRHEGIHALKELGAFTPQQWKVLENKAKSEWVKKYDIRNRYKQMRLPESEIIEEAIADAFSDFDQTKPPAGLVGALFRKIKQFFEAFGNALDGLGFQTADSVFQRTEEGGLKVGAAAPLTVRPSGETEPRYQLPRVMSNGKIVGAPPGMATEEDRALLVERMANLLSHPYSLYDESKDWYEASGAAIREITRGDPELTERVVRLMALYSQANGVGGNTTATIASIAQLASGESTAFAGRFPNTTAARIPQLLAAPTMDSSLPGVDDKLMNFYRNLHDATYQVDTFQDASTIDRWMMRLFGYPHAEDQDAGGATGVSNTQYIYAKDLIERISAANEQRTGEALKPRQVQAVLWTYVKNMTDYNSLTPEKQAKFEPSIIDFSDYITRATANITWETRPSTKLPLIPGIHQATREQQEAFNRAVKEIFIDPETGEDKIFKLLGNQQLYSSQFSIGAYENLIAPNVITKLVLQKDDGNYLTEVANKYASIIGYVTKQDAVPWYRADPTAGSKDASKGYRVTASVAADPAFEERLFTHLNKEIPGIGFTRVGDSFDFINFRDTDSGRPYMMSDSQYLGKLQKALESFDEKIDFDVEPFRAKSGWIANDWTENANGQSYLERFSPDELADLRRFIDGWSADYDRIAEQFGKEYGWSEPKKFSLRPGAEGGEAGPGTIRAYALRRTDTPEFKRWFGDSKIVYGRDMGGVSGDMVMDWKGIPEDDQEDYWGDLTQSERDALTKEYRDRNVGKGPKVMYHGTARDITEFQAKQANAIFLTDDPTFAAGFSDMSRDYMVDEAIRNLDSKDVKEIAKEVRKKIVANYGSASSGYGKRVNDALKEWVSGEGSLEGELLDYAREMIEARLASGPNIMPMYVRAEKPFDYESDADIEELTQSPSGQNLYPEELDVIRMGRWDIIEKPHVQRAIKEAGFDAFYVMEAGRKNLAVYNKDQIKSAIGNVGAYGQRPVTQEEADRAGMTVEEATAAQARGDIRFALSMKDLAPDSSLVPDEGGNPDGTLGAMPDKFGNKPIRMLIGFHDDLEDKGYGANHILLRVLEDRERIPGGAEELLEKIVRTAQSTAQNYRAVYKDGNKLVLHDGRNNLILAQRPEGMSVVTMFVMDNPRAKYGAPVWTGKASNVAQFVQPLRGLSVEAQEGRVGIKRPPVQTKRVFTPSQITDSAVETPAVQTSGTLSVKKGGFKFSLRETLGDDMVESIERTTTAREERGFAGKIADALSPTGFAKFRQGMINRYEGIERLSKKAAAEFGDNELLADTSAIAAALFADRAAGVAAESFKSGIPIYKNGFTAISDMDGAVKGLIPILEPLMELNDPFAFQAFQFYAGTRRGRRLTAEGREKLFTPEDIQKGKLLEQNYPMFREVFDQYQKYNEGLVKFMRDTGVISDQEAKIWTQNWDYIPFYRQLEGDDTAGPKVFSSIAGVAKPKKLKGGEAPLADFLETVVRNSRAAIEAGMKNVAAQRVARDMLRLNQGELVPASAKGSDIMTVKDNGLTKHYRVHDPLLFEALKGLNLPQLPFLEILAAPSNLLRNLVTKDPGFMLANLMRDSLQAWVTTGTNMTPVVDTFKQYGAALAGMSPEAKQLAKAGLFAGYDFSNDVNSSAREVERELRMRSGQRTMKDIALWPLSKTWEMLEKASSASDVATRAEVYKRTLERTGNEAEALYQAMEVMNFSRKGNSALIRVLTALVPFMNARIQGLDVLYRSGFGESATQNRERMQKAFITRSLSILALSSMYWALASDTEEYKTAEQEVRDNYWIIGSVRIPIPFEIGTLFKVFPERILEYSFGQDTGKDLKDSIIRNMTSTLSINPIPQAFLPVVENVANYSFFTGQPIVGKGMEDVAAKYQVTPGTSILAQRVGEALNTSPMKVDNLIRGYTGTLGTYASLMIDSVLRGEGDPTKAAMRLEQMPVFKRFYASPESTGTVTGYYDLKRAVDESARTINFLERTNNGQELAEYLKGRGGKLLSIKPYIESLNTQMGELRDLRRTIQMSQIDPERKRDVLDAIRKSEVALTRQVQRIKQVVY